MSPELIFDSRRLATNIDRLRDVLPASNINYAVKACGEPQVLQAIANCGVGFEIASVGELQRALETGVAAPKVHCGLPAKGDAATAELSAMGCNSFVFDCEEELSSLRKHAPGSRKLLRVAIDQIDPESAAWGFGDAALASFQATNGGNFDDIAGVTFHLARNYRRGLLSAVFERVGRVLEHLSGAAPQVLNIGGGYRVELPPHLARKYDLDAFYDELVERVGRLQDRHGCRVEAEPGRGIVESAAELRVPVMRVRNDAAGVTEVTVDLNIGQRPGSHPSAVHALHAGERELLYVAGAELAPPGDYPCMTAFLDATCEYSVFYRLPLKRPPRPGEILALSGMGAYTACLSSVFHVRSGPRIRVI